MRVVVSGVGGFVGSHLTADLVGAGHEVVGVGLGEAPAFAEQLAAYFIADLTHGWPAEALAGADAVIHLAALAEVGPSFVHPQRYIEANSSPLTFLGEALLSATSSARIVFVSTGAVYAPGVGLDESSLVEPTSPYSVSKLLGETQCAYYRRRGLDVVVVRPFNHIGPGQGPGFLLPDLVSGMRRAQESGEPLVVGDLSTRRDYTDVRDVVRAYRLLIEAASVPPLVNVCSGSSVSGAEMLAAVTDALGAEGISATVDPGRLRPGDPAEISGDNSLLRTGLGWKPEIGFAQTVADVVGA